MSVDGDDEPTTIGRADENTIKIEHATISARHCVIEFEMRGIPGSDLREPVCVLKDVSTNGVFVNGQLIGKGLSAVLKDRDVVKLAKNQLCRLEYLLKVRLAPAVREALAAVARAAAAAAGPVGGAGAVASAAAVPAPSPPAPVVREGDVHEFYDFQEGEKPDPGPDFLVRGAAQLTAIICTAVISCCLRCGATGLLLQL